MLFLGECAYLALLVGSSIALHNCWAIAGVALRGSSAKDSYYTREIFARVCEQAVLTLLVLWQVANVIPRLRQRATAAEVATLDATQTVATWVWDYGFVDSWWFIVVKYGTKAWFNGSLELAQFVFWCQLGCLILMATVVAHASPDANFYQCRTSRKGHALSLLLYWLIDFGTWWGWYGTLLDVGMSVPGKDVFTRSTRSIGLNVLIIFVLSVTIPVIYALNGDATRRAKEANNIRSLQHVEPQRDPAGNMAESLECLPRTECVSWPFSLLDALKAQASRWRAAFFKGRA
eukprot:6735513-Prymnesium_polylepis.1